MRQKGLKFQEHAENPDHYQYRRHIVPAGPTVYFQKASISEVKIIFSDRAVDVGSDLAWISKL